MLKRKLTYYLLSCAIITTALFFAGSVSFILALNAQATPAPAPTSQISLLPSPSPSLSPSPSPTSLPKTAIKPSPIPTPTSTPAPTPTPVPANSSSTEANKPRVQLSINGGGSLSVEVSDGNNQCDVLSKALEQGKISQLNMRYDSNYGSYAVYQINNLGSESTVRWVYKVNGQSPNLGCSYIKANSGDNIEWSYQGS